MTFSAHAATITVNTLTDENNTNNAACSLREAINNANGDNTTNGLGCVAGSGTDSIVFSVSGTINLTAVLPTITSSMNIGNNTTTAPNLTVNRSSGGNYRIFLVDSGNTVAMNGLIINNGFAFESAGGGINNNGTLTITNCIISNNQSSNDGGGIANNTSLTIINSSIINNSGPAYGAGLAHGGTSLTVNNSTFSGNTAIGAGGGGAIDILGSNTTITNSTFTNNTAYGGGAINAAASATITNCTFSGNNATAFTSSLLVNNSAVVNVTNSTFAQNTRGAINNAGGTINLRNTIVAGNVAADGTTPENIGGTVSASSLNNIIGTGGAGGLTNGVNGNQVGVSFANVRLLPLGSYGGSVQTMPIRPNSPARNAGTNTGAPATDARGFNRPQATTTDIGAFEIQTNSIVTNTNNSGAGSLRQVVADVTSGDTIQFETPLFDTAQTISLSAGQITLGKNLTIYGNGANILNVQNTAAASATSRVFNISTGFTVNLNGVTVTGGNVTSDGGGILNSDGILSIADCVITGNTASGDGGGIRSPGNLTVRGSTISNNTANSSGGNKAGGIDFSGSSLVITNSTVSGNSSLGGNNNAGGIWSNNTTTITNSTITNNIANGTNSGSGIYKTGVPIITVRNSIIAANQNNATVPDISGGFTSSGYNLVGNVGTATGFNQPTDQTGTNPLFENSDGKSLAPTAVLSPGLLPLAMNGGTIPTHALSGGSPALDKGNSFGSTTDARGLTRPVDLAGITNAAGGNGAEIGAFEAQFAPTSAAVSISGQVFTTNGRGLRNALITITNNQGNSITVRTSPFGFYRFDEIPVGETYVIEVRSKNFQFSPQIVSVSEELTGLDFYAVSEFMGGK